MATKYSLIRGAEDNFPYAGIIVSDHGFEYVYIDPDADETGPEPERVLERAYPEGVPEGLTIDDYADVAPSAFGYSSVDEFTDAQNRSAALRIIKEALKEAKKLYVAPETRAAEGRINSSASRVRQDNLDADDEMAGSSSSEMLDLIMASLSDTSREGPNGWLIRQINGEDPEPGDELGVYHF